MDQQALEFFKRILETPSPSGYEQPVQQIVREYASDFADEVPPPLYSIHKGVVKNVQSFGAFVGESAVPQRRGCLTRVRCR